MKAETPTGVMNPGEIVSSAEADQNFERLCGEAKELHDVRRFGTIGFSNYYEWVLKNLLPLSKRSTSA